MLIEYIEKLRTKPHAVRRRVAFVSAIAVTGIAAAFWSFSLPARLGSIDVDTEALTGAAEEAIQNPAAESELQKFINQQETFEGNAPQDFAPAYAPPEATPTPSRPAIIATSSSERSE